MDTLRFDDDQFRQAVEKFKDTPRPRFQIADILSFVQIVAIICGGIWVLIEYASFREQHEQLTIREQELALEMARVTLELKGGERALQQIELDQSTTSQIQYPTRTLTVKHLANRSEKRLFEAMLTVEIENVSKSSFEVSYSIVQYFLGSPRESTQEDDVVAIQHPPGLFGESRVGALEWRQVGCQASKYFRTKHAVSSIFEKANCSSVDQSGGLTATLAPGERSAFSQTYLVSAGKSEYLALAVYFGIDGVIEPGHGMIKYFREVVPLVETTRSGNRLYPAD